MSAEWVLIIVEGVGVVLALVTALDSKRRAKDAGKAVERMTIAIERVAEASERIREGTAPLVAWSLTRLGKSQFVLRNVGQSTAFEVTVNTGETLARDVPVGVEVASLRSVEFMMIDSMQRHLPHEVEVSWRDTEERSQVLPVPL